MKKNIFVIMALSLAILVIGISGCGKTAQAAEPVGMPNPMTELTQEEFEACSFNLTAPEGAEDIKYFSIAGGDNAITQMSFTLDGAKYSIRVQPTNITSGELPDISGMFYEWTHTEEVQVGYNTAHFYCRDGGPGHICWLDVVPGLLYDLSVDTGADRDTMASLAELCCPPVQGNA